MILTPASQKALSQGLLDVLIRAGLVAVLVIACYQVFHPFLNLMLWSVILAVTLYPLHRRLKPRLGNRDGRTATVLVLICIIVLLVPLYLLGMSLGSSVAHGMEVVRSGSFHIPPPPDSVAGWPLVGERLHGVWQQAATDLTSLAQKFTPQIKAFSLTLLGKATGLGLGLLMFIAALAIAGIVMAYADAGQRSAVKIASRFFGLPKGPKITELCTGTIRAVAQGVVGIAFIQMLLIGVAFVLMDIPGAAVLSMAVLLLGIMQIPATLITVPVIIFVIATRGADVGTIVFSVYVFLAGLADNVLKPLLLGRGVEVPMPVVLIGALGGMVTSGIIGLFIGPVLLAVGYMLFWQWIEDHPAGSLPVEIPNGPEQA
ncbi:AI-2E family transporter [Lysobacter niabensis]|uniref:AI-2E family transporter n=1 Tax=Agrilutibacter niabensis TaxID=380628 RepID=UPI003620A4E2